VNIAPADDILYRALLADFPLPRWIISRDGTVITARQAGSTVTYRDPSAAVIRAALGRLRDAAQVSASGSWPPGRR
jgi:hypothetical protein